MEKRIVAFDIGDKRIGVAVTDPFGEYAIPSDTYFRTGDLKADIAALLGRVRELGAEEIVCGLPLNADGTESVQTQKTMRFISALRKEAWCLVATQDERYTTMAARRDLVSAGVSTKRDKRKAIDSVAAAYILEEYLAEHQLNRKGDANMNFKEEEGGYEEENNTVELVDDEGVEHRFAHRGTLEYKGEWYCCFSPEMSDEDDTEEEIVIFHLVGEEDDEHLETIDDDALLDEVFAEFCRQYEDSEDADEAALLEPNKE